MPTLPEIASERSGVPMIEAFAIDQSPSVYDILRREKIIEISTAFYNRVYADDEKWFRDIFASSTKEEAIQNQYEFFIQRWGGPPLYSQRKGHPALLARHANFAMNDKSAVRWMEHMTAAVNEVQGIDDGCKKRILDFLKHTAYFLSAGMELMKQRQQQEQLGGGS